MFKRKNAFTLAEVLITLGIIGVVAAMTVPTLVGQTGEQEYKTGLKKAVSTINQAVQLNYVKYGYDFSTVGEGATFAALFGNNLNVQNKSVTADNFVGGSKGSMAGTLYLLNDGMIIGFPSENAACTTASTSCVLWVDTNGYKRPNTASTKTSSASGVMTDQFQLYIYNQTVVPANDAAKYALYDVVSSSSKK